MLDILKKEWNLVIKKWMGMSAIALLCSLLIGCGIVCIVMTVVGENEFICLGTVFSLYVSGVILFLFVTTLFNTRFSLLVSLGQKRSFVVKYMIFTTCAITVFTYGLTMIVYFIEKALYPLLFVNSMHAEGFSLDILIQYGLFLYFVIVAGMWVLYIFVMKFGEQIFAIACMAFVAVVVLLERIIEADNGRLSALSAKSEQFWESITATGWVITGIVFIICSLTVGYGVMKKHNI